MLGIYTRLSKEDLESSSISNQLREGKEFAKSRNFNEFKIYDEGEGVSGTLKLEERPELFNLIQDIKTGLIKVVWMRNQNRLERNTATFIIFVTACRENNVDVYFGDNGKLDFNDPATELQSTVLSGLNQYQARLQSKQTKKSLMDNFKEGKVWGIYPYGYRTDDDMIPYIDEVEAEIINQIFNDYLLGKSTYTIANELNDRNIPTKYSQLEGDLKTKNKYTKKVKSKSKGAIQWSEKTIKDILSNTWYNGTRTYSGETGTVPRIVDEILYNKVQQAIKARKGVRTSTPKYQYLLKGLLRCDKCGRNYYGRFRPDKSDNYYMCSGDRKKSTKCGNKGINIPKLESFIIKHLFKSKDLLKMMESLSKKNEVVNEIDKEIERLESDYLKEEGRVKKYAKLLGEELEDDELILNQYRNSKKNLEEIKEKLLKLKTQKSDITNSEALNNYKKELDSIGSKSDFKTYEKAVNNIIENITIDTVIDNKLNKAIYYITIEYKGLSESNTFITKQPYDKWLHLSNFKTEETDEDIEDNVAYYEFMYKEETGFDFKVPKEDYHKFKSESVFSTGFPDSIELIKEDIIEFN